MSRKGRICSRSSGHKVALHARLRCGCVVLACAVGLCRCCAICLCVVVVQCKHSHHSCPVIWSRGGRPRCCAAHWRAEAFCVVAAVCDTVGIHGNTCVVWRRRQRELAPCCCLAVVAVKDAGVACRTHTGSHSHSGGHGCRCVVLCPAVAGSKRCVARLCETGRGCGHVAIRHRREARCVLVPICESGHAVLCSGTFGVSGPVPGLACRGHVDPNGAIAGRSCVVHHCVTPS